MTAHTTMRETVDAVYRAESRRVFATLIRLLGDFDAAEEALHEAFAALLLDPDRQYTGIRFRMIDEQDCIRRHIRIFVNGRQTHDLAQPLAETDEIIIVQALSGG